MISSSDTKRRIAYFDIAKGILICLLLYGHMIIIARIEGINDIVMPVIQKSIKLYNAFFMQTFFIITGFCSSFNKDFRHFIWGNVKMLLIPAVLLVMISSFLQNLFWDQSIGASTNLLLWFANGGPWFIVTLFWAKLAYWLIVKLSVWQQFLIIGALYLLGILLNIIDVIPNYSYHRHVLLMLPYLFVGHFWKEHKEKFNPWIRPLAIIGIVSIVLQFVISQFVDFYTIPTHDAYIHINKTFPIHIINVITCSAFIIWLSSIIKCNKILETFGKGTLLIYLWNGLINRFILHILPTPSSDSIISSIVFHTLVYFLMLVLFYSLIKLIYNTKYLSWLVGKW